ncbi:MAG TPA: hypothetical protein VK348_07360 [Planctomycetota bacterium]|nr:hypothetical protein [Planctomycetota bacterium]
MPSSRQIVAAALLAAASTLPAQATELGCDRNAIHWVLPGDFPTALTRAKAEQRMLVVKGISFGVDTDGARCATKGVW